ncbi:MAG TPA: DUF2892 domain-containing protein [Roseiflexaceae bacterium]|nr:DUF2892 domain-containing protein [Roseiflexaceae bacterium]
MLQNVSVLDRDVRLALGAVLMYLAVFVIPGVWSFAVGGLALALFATAALGFCPIYALLGRGASHAAGKGERG